MTTLEEPGAREIARYEEIRSDRAMKDLHDKLAQATAALGFEQFLFCDLPAAAPVEAMTFVTNYSRDWMYRYLRNGYRAHDLAAINAGQLGRAFLWSEVQDRRNLTKNQCRVVDESSTFGLRYGATLPATGPQGMSAMNVASRMSGSKSPREFAKLFAAKRQALEELHQMASDRLNGIGKKNRRASAPPPIPSGKKVLLTPHESAALTYAAHGLTRQQIAAEMDISAYTVKDHLENVLDKLHAKNTTNAVFIATRARMIWP